MTEAVGKGTITAITTAFQMFEQRNRRNLKRPKLTSRGETL